MAIEVDIDLLLKLSMDLLDKYPSNGDVYSLLLLALVTVIEYSRSITKLGSSGKIETAIQYIPELLNMLKAEKHMNHEVCVKMEQKLALIKDDIPDIMRSYIYMAWGYRKTEEPSESKDRKHKTAKK